MSLQKTKVKKLNRFLGIIILTNDMAQREQQKAIATLGILVSRDKILMQNFMEITVIVAANWAINPTIVQIIDKLTWLK